jgi:hypothetical protein
MAAKKRKKRLTRQEYLDQLEKEIERAKKVYHHEKSFGEDDMDIVLARGFKVGLQTARDLAKRMF